MPTDAEQIATIKTQTLALIVTVTASANPSYSIDGVSFSKSEYLKTLQETVEWCDSQLGTGTAEPFEIISTGF